MTLDVTNFNDFTKEEYTENLNRLGITNYSELVGKHVYYSKKSYGVHKVIAWYPSTGRYLLELDGYRFDSNPFIIILV